MKKISLILALILAMLLVTPAWADNPDGEPTEDEIVFKTGFDSDKNIEAYVTLSAGGSITLYVNGEMMPAYYYSGGGTTYIENPFDATELLALIEELRALIEGLEGSTPIEIENLLSQVENLYTENGLTVQEINDLQQRLNIFVHGISIRLQGNRAQILNLKALVMNLDKRITQLSVSVNQQLVKLSAKVVELEQQFTVLEEDYNGMKTENEDFQKWARERIDNQKWLGVILCVIVAALAFIVLIVGDKKK